MSYRIEQSDIDIFYTDISCLGGVFAKKYQWRDEQFPQPKGEGNLV